MSVHDDTLHVTDSILEAVNRPGRWSHSLEGDDGLQVCLVSEQTGDDFIAPGGQDVLWSNDAMVARLRWIGKCAMATRHDMFVLVVLDDWAGPQ